MPKAILTVPIITATTAPQRGPSITPERTLMKCWPGKAFEPSHSNQRGEITTPKAERRDARAIFFVTAVFFIISFQLV
jgi:hypothetical protein